MGSQTLPSYSQDIAQFYQLSLILERIGQRGPETWVFVERCALFNRGLTL